MYSALVLAALIVIGYPAYRNLQRAGLESQTRESSRSRVCLIGRIPAHTQSIQVPKNFRRSALLAFYDNGSSPKRFRAKGKKRKILLREKSSSLTALLCKKGEWILEGGTRLRVRRLQKQGKSGRRKLRRFVGDAHFAAGTRNSRKRTAVASFTLPEEADFARSDEFDLVITESKDLGNTTRGTELYMQGIGPSHSKYALLAPGEGQSLEKIQRQRELREEELSWFIFAVLSGVPASDHYSTSLPSIPLSSQTATPSATPTATPTEIPKEKCGEGECLKGETCCHDQMCCTEEETCKQHDGKAYCADKKCPKDEHLCGDEDNRWATCCDKDEECMSYFGVYDCGHKECPKGTSRCGGGFGSWTKRYRCCRDEFEYCHILTESSNWPTCQAKEPKDEDYVRCSGEGDFDFAHIQCRKSDGCALFPNGAPRCGRGGSSRLAPAPLIDEPRDLPPLWLLKTLPPMEER